MIRRPPRSTRTDTLFPYTTLFRSLYAVYALETYLPSLQISGKLPENVKITAVTQAELQKMSVLRTPNKVLAVAHLPRNAVHPPWETGPKQTDANGGPAGRPTDRSEEHTSELQSLMRISYAVICLTKQTSTKLNTN